MTTLKISYENTLSRYEVIYTGSAQGSTEALELTGAENLGSVKTKI
jgi:hypothetical protein